MSSIPSLGEQANLQVCIAAHGREPSQKRACQGGAGGGSRGWAPGCAHGSPVEAPQGVKAVPWWTPELSVLKTRFRRARKKRRRSSQHEEELQCELLALNRPMHTAKSRSWHKFCSEDKQPPFDGVYKAILQGRGSNPIIDTERSVSTLLNNLFPDRAAEASEDAAVAAVQERVERWVSQFENLCSKGAVELIMVRGVAGGRPAGLTKQGTARRLRGVPCLAALAMTGCFRMTSTSAALALASLLPEEMAAGKKLVQQQYCHARLSSRLETIRPPCKWSPHL